jgi:hypothetical protein
VKPSPAQLEALKMAAAHGGLVYWPGGFWTYPGCDVVREGVAQGRSYAVPAWSTSTHTIKALETRGWVVTTGAGPAWSLRRVLTAAGRALVPPTVRRNSGDPPWAQPWASNEEYYEWQRREKARKIAAARTAAGKLAVMYDGEPDETGKMSHGWGPHPHNLRIQYGTAYFDPGALPERLWYEAPLTDGREAIAAYILANGIVPTRGNPRGLRRGQR